MAYAHQVGMCSYVSNSFKDFSSNNWLIDSGATNHIVSNSKLLTPSQILSNTFVSLPTRQKIRVSHIGSVQLTPYNTLTKDLCVPYFNINLIIINIITSESKCSLIFLLTPTSFRITSQGKWLVLLNKTKHFTTFKTTCFSDSSVIVAAKTATLSDFVLWHKRLVRLAFNKLPFLNKDIDIVLLSTQFFCDVCPLAKQHMISLPIGNIKFVTVFDKTHLDIWGPYEVVSLTGHSYFLTIVDDFSRCIRIYLMKHKSEVPNIIKYFHALIHTQVGLKIKCVQSDNGPEFNPTDFYSVNSILHYTFCVGTPQQNGVVQRKHQHLLKVARALRFQANLHFQFWGSVKTGVYLMNITPPLLQNKSPFEVMFGVSPDYNSLKVLGVYALLLLFRMIEENLILELRSACFLVIL